jgi:hypothetical protein
VVLLLPKSPPAAGVAEAPVAAGVVDAPPNREPAGLLLFPNKLVAPPLAPAPAAALPNKPPDGAGEGVVPLAVLFPKRPPVVDGCENKPPVAGCVVAGVVVPNEKLGVPVVEADPNRPPAPGAVVVFAGLEAPLEPAPPAEPNVNDIAAGYM